MVRLEYPARLGLLDPLVVSVLQELTEFQVPQGQRVLLVSRDPQDSPASPVYQDPQAVRPVHRVLPVPEGSRVLPDQQDRTVTKDHRATEDPLVLQDHWVQPVL